MRVIRADVMGMCFGVRDALETIGRIAAPELVTIHGQLVHNEVVLDGLAERGFRMVGERDRSGIPETPTVLVTAHGVSDRERERLSRAGKAILDTTCPLVTRVHQAAQRLEREGYHVLVIGVRAHVEVRGVVDDLTSFTVVGSADEVRTYPAQRLGIVCQTTVPESLVARVRAAVAAKNPGAEIRFVDTVCLPTKEHQRALDRLIDQVEAVVVVGGTESNNTRALAARCEARGKPALRVASADELDPAWFRGLTSVGLTAGTSTLDSTIDEVDAVIRRIAADARELEPVGAARS
jgi:4-hydroxy-3-methylbut-2-enyl diphosphate reductase